MKTTGLFGYIRNYAPLLLVILSAGVAVGAYLQALQYPFVSDDLTYVADNKKLLQLQWVELWHLFTEPYNSMAEFLPLREFSYWLDVTLFGLNPAAFRCDSIILYLLCLPLIYGITLSLWRYFRPSDTANAAWPAASVTALFVLHPSHTEAVVWIAGRKDVLSGLFLLLAFWFAINVRREHGFSAPLAIAALIALVAAILSKATAVAGAPIIVMIWMIYWRDIPVFHRHRSLLLWPLTSLLLAVFLALVFAVIIPSRVPFYFGVEAITRTLAVLGWLIRLVVSPESRHFIYPVFEDTNFYWMAGVGGITLLVVVASLIMFFRKQTLESFTVVTFFLLCAPSLQLVPYSPPSLASDRFIFLAVWPIMLLIVALAWRLKPVFRTILLIVIILFSFETIERPRDWRNFETLIEADFSAFPGYSIPAMYKVGIELSEKRYLEAVDTANSITIPEARNSMAKLVEAHQALVDSAATRNPSRAMEIFLDYGRDLKTLPIEAQWNTPLIFMWHKNRIYLGQEWRNLSKIFPNDALVRNNANSALSEPWRDVVAVPANAQLLRRESVFHSEYP